MLAGKIDNLPCSNIGYGQKFELYKIMLNYLISPVSLLYKIMDWYNWCVILALNPWLLMTKYARLFGHQNIFCNLAHSYDWWKQYDSKCLGLHPDPIWPRNSWCLKCHRLSKKNRHKMKRLDYNSMHFFPKNLDLGLSIILFS